MQLLSAVNDLPKLFSLSSVGTEGNGSLSIRNHQTNCRHNVVHRDCRDVEMRDAKFLARLEGQVLHDAAVFVLQFIELWINRVIEDVELQQFNYFRGCMNAYGLFQLAE